MHGVVRKLCMDYITKNADYFSHYLTEPFDQYVERKRRANAHGNHIEMHALSEMFNRPIEIYHYSEGMYLNFLPIYWYIQHVLRTYFFSVRIFAWAADCFIARFSCCFGPWFRFLKKLGYTRNYRVIDAAIGLQWVFTFLGSIWWFTEIQ